MKVGGSNFYPKENPMDIGETDFIKRSNDLFE